MGYYSGLHAELTLRGELEEFEPSFQDYPDEYVNVKCKDNMVPKSIDKTFKRIDKIHKKHSVSQFEFHNNLVEALSVYDTGHWDFDEIDASFSRKDDDLNSSHCGVLVKGVTEVEGEEELQCIAKYSATLPVPEGLPRDFDLSYMISMLPENSEWGDEEWYCTGEREFTVPIQHNEKMAEAIYDKTMEVMEPINKEISYARNVMDSLFDEIICKYCESNCPVDPENACDGYLGDVDGLYEKE